MSITGGGISSLIENVAQVQEDTTAIKAKGVVKSVQRGVVDTPPSQINTWVDVASISPIDLEKSVLIFSLVRTASGSSNVRFSLTQNTIQANGSHGVPAFAWQVVEFY